MNLLFTTNHQPNCENTTNAVQPFAQNLTNAAAILWERSTNAGAIWTPNPAQPIVHVAAATQTERFRTFYRIPPGYSGTYAVTISGDKYDAPNNDQGYLYYDDVFVGRTGLAAAMVINLPVVPGLHKLEWRHGIAGAGQTSLNISFNYANVTYKQDCCPLQLTKCSQMRYTPSCLITPVATQVVPKTTGAFAVAVTANPNGYGIINIAATGDNNTAGASYGGIDRPANASAPGVVIRYTNPVNFNRVIRVKLWNNGGGNVNDSDGLASATVTLRDSALNILYTGTLIGANGGAVQSLNNIGKIDNVRYLFLSNITSLTGSASPDILWRNIQMEAAALTDFIWSCGDFSLKARFDSPDVAPTIVNGVLNQIPTASPATLTFTSSHEFSGFIKTNRPNDFSSLNITNGTQITVTNTGVNAKWLIPYVTFVDDPIMTFASKCEGEDVIWRNANGEFVPTEYLVECE